MSTNFNKYQADTRQTAIYPKEECIEYLLFGIVSECGELAGAYKKLLRGDYSYDDFKDKMYYEIGDVLWYLSRLADDLELWMDDIADANMDKLLDRADRDVIHGDGDER